MTECRTDVEIDTRFPNSCVLAHREEYWGANLHDETITPLLTVDTRSILTRYSNPLYQVDHGSYCSSAGLKERMGQRCFLWIWR